MALSRISRFLKRGFFSENKEILKDMGNMINQYIKQAESHHFRVLKKVLESEESCALQIFCKIEGSGFFGQRVKWVVGNDFEEEEEEKERRRRKKKKGKKIKSKTYFSRNSYKQERKFVEKIEEVFSPLVVCFNYRFGDCVKICKNETSCYISCNGGSSRGEFFKKDYVIWTQENNYREKEKIYILEPFVFIEELFD